MNWQPDLISALIAALVSFVGAVATLRKVKSETAATATVMYEKLCTSLMVRVESLNKRLTELEAEKDELVERYTKEIEGLEEQLHDLREALVGKQRQIETLQARVTELETENTKLKAELERICNERAQRQPSRR